MRTCSPFLYAITAYRQECTKMKKAIEYKVHHYY